MLRKELTYYFTTPVAYIVIGLYQLALSLLLWVIPGQWNIVDSGYAQLDSLAQIAPWMLILLCPAMTMRLFAEERSSGMWDLLKTKPYPMWRIVLDKYTAAFLIGLFAILPSFVHYVLVAWMAEPMGNLDLGQFVGQQIGLILLLAAMMGVSTFLSTFSRSQIVCYSLSAAACLVIYLFLLYDSYEALARGVMTMHDVILMLTTAAVGVIATTIKE